MAAIPWNGREIGMVSLFRSTLPAPRIYGFFAETNQFTVTAAFQTAVYHAQYQFAMLEDGEEEKKAMLDWEHFEEVCAITTNSRTTSREYTKRMNKNEPFERRIENSMTKNNAGFCGCS